MLDAVGEFDYDEHLVGGASIDAHGTALTDEVLDACRGADAVLLGAVGGPQWDTTDPDAPRPEQGLLGLRKGLGPVREPATGEADRGAARTRARCAANGSRARTSLVVRELTGGIYFGEKTAHRDDAPATPASTRSRRSSASPGSGSRPPADAVAT